MLCRKELRTKGHLREAQKRKNHGLSASYVHGFYALLRSCLDAAGREKLILLIITKLCKNALVVILIQHFQPSGIAVEDNKQIAALSSAVLPIRNNPKVPTASVNFIISRQMIKLTLDFYVLLR